jgi:hypothetical protein
MYFSGWLRELMERTSQTAKRVATSSENELLDRARAKNDLELEEVGL